MFIHQRDGGGIPDCVDAIFTLHLESALNPHISFRVKATRAVPDAGQPEETAPDSPEAR